ncbi:MAG: hypothetical protein ABJE95_11925 [Byssovorax sp.]
MQGSVTLSAIEAGLISLCDDLLFAVCSSRRLDFDELEALAARREPALAATLGGAARQGLEDWEPWLLALCASIAPIAPPHWMPMAGAIDSGLSLTHGARGFRALFTDEPSEKTIARVRVLGALAVRTLGSVLGADGNFTREKHVLRGALIASLGVPEQDRRLLDAEPPLDAHSLDLLPGMDGNIVRSIVRGAFYAAMGDGIDPRQEAAITLIGHGLGLDDAGIAAARDEARERIDSSRPLGDAAVEAIRYVLSDDADARARTGFATMRLTLPPVFRIDAAKALTVGLPAVLARKHDLDREGREAALALAWIVALRGNPTRARSLELAGRHDRVAADLGEAAEGRAVRGAIDRHVDTVLGALLASATA